MTVSEEIIKVLDSICAKFGIVVDWSAENIIPFLTQLCGRFVTYEIATSVLWIGLGAVIGIVGYLFLSKHPKIGVWRYETEYEDRTTRYMYITFISAIVGLFLFVQLHDIVTCVTFPEKFIIDEILAKCAAYR
jgi:hypothetical protein